MDLARGEGMLESSDESEDDVEVEALSDAEVGPWADEAIPEGDETRRFAAVNMDWENIKAKDLMKVFDGFKPPHGMVKRVCIYPSEFGKERMAQEQVQGPPVAVFNADSEDEVENDEGKDFNMAALRKYQLERLRYLYILTLATTTRLSNVILLIQLVRFLQLVTGLSLNLLAISLT